MPEEVGAGEGGGAIHVVPYVQKSDIVLLTCFADNEGAAWCHSPADKDFYTDTHVSA